MGQQIWRTISLENLQNAILLNTDNTCREISLFEIIKFGLFEKGLNAFSSEDFSKPQNYVLSKKQILDVITRQDTIIEWVFDAKGDKSQETTVAKKYMMGADIKSYLIKEDWIMNSYKGKMEKYIVAIAPLIYNLKTERVSPLFWLYYLEWQSLFSCFSAKNFYSYEPISYDDVFCKHYFVSQINKETNIFDRSIKSTSHGRDVYLENELIREKLRNAESDLFEH